MQLWKRYRVFTSKEKIIEVANGNPIGGFVNTDGVWCITRSPKEFKEMLEHFFGFTVISCVKTEHSTAIATTECGLQIAWNGYCRRINSREE